MNAAKYSPRDTAIELDASSDSAGVQIVVRDRGEGIAAEDLPFVFDPFFRADRVRTKKGPGGVGLGLSLVRRIVEAHGGTIELAPAEDRGTRATIRLSAAAFTNPHEPPIRRSRSARKVSENSFRAFALSKSPHESSDTLLP